MSFIKKVAVIGASGTVGTPIVSALLGSGFSVTAISRRESKATFPAGVIVSKVDISSIPALTQALKDQDAVISTVTTAATGDQKLLIDAAVAAHVKRFIPSEFGINTRDSRGTKIGKLIMGKTESVDYLIEVSKKHEWFTWTGFSTGSFFDWSLRYGVLGFDLKAKTAKIFDSGNEPYSVSNLPFIGKCVVSVLNHPEKTANKYLSIASFTTTQNEVLKILEEETGVKFGIANIKTVDMAKIGDEKAAKGEYGAFFQYAIEWLFGDGNAHAHAVKENDAELLLGLKEEDVRATIKVILAEL